MTGLTPSSNVDPLNIPADLHVSTPEQKQVYSSALEFERFFVQQMLKPMENAGSLLGGGEDGGEDAAGSAGMSGYKDMAQDQMTQAVLDGGGLGIAATLYQQMAEAAGVATPKQDAAPKKDAAS
jgi:Rod binding domain-containing protein